MKLNFKGKDIFTGLDVHTKSWVASMVSEHVIHKQMSISPPQPGTLANFLRKEYPGATYHCAYEAGYCGFWIQRELTKLGIPTIVIHPADIPTTDKERRQKEDKRDSRKIALALRAGLLKPIYVPTRQQEQDRSIVRQRYSIVKDKQRIQNRIRSHLSYKGHLFYEKAVGKYWSRNMIAKLREHAERTVDTALQMLLDSLYTLRQLTLDSTRTLRALSREPRHRKNVELLQSIPGVGLLTAMVFLTEVGDVSRFNWDQLHSYCGLIPGSHSSGDREKKSRLTNRGNKHLRTALILSSWPALRSDTEMLLTYESLRKRMNGQRAIIRIAKKQANRMKSILQKQQKFKRK